MIIQRLQQMDRLNLRDEKSLPHYKRPAGNWVQYKMRVAGDGFRDDVYYEIERGRNSTVRGQLHIHSECGRRTSELRDEILRIAHICEFTHTKETSQDFKIYGGMSIDLVGRDEDEVIDILRQQLHELYDAFEGCLCQKEAAGVLVASYDGGAGLSRETQDGSGTEAAEPWYVNYRCNEDYLDRGYDERIRDVEGLTWLPWVGKNYNNARLLVVGESNYADRVGQETVESAIDRVNGDEWFTRKVVSAFGAERIISNKTFEGIARMLNVNEDAGEVDAEFPLTVWRKVAYVDLLQCALRGNGWNPDNKRARPSEGRTKNEERALWMEGCRVIFNLIELLEPHAVLCVGCGAADWLCGARSEDGRWRCERINCDYRVCGGKRPSKLRKMQICDGETSIPVVGVPNPGGTYGFGANAQIRVRNEILRNDNRFFGCLAR